jgi:signal transduction histidine kinase
VSAGEDTRKNLLSPYERALLILEVATDGTIRAANPLSVQLLGGQIVGKRLKEVFLDFRGVLDLTKLVAEGSQPHLVNVATAGGLPETFYFRFFPVAGNIIAIGELNWQEVEDLRLELVRANNELHNLTRELHRRNAELTRRNILKEHFLGMVAHDLRSPLTVIMGFCDFMISEADQQHPEFVDLLREICEQSTFMLTLIDELLDLTAMEMGQPHIKAELVDASRLLRKTVRMHQLLAGKKGIDLRLEDHLPPGEVCLDVAKIGQVLNNLVSNAIKFSSSGARVTVSARAEQDEFIIAVKDEGQGISADEMPRLFTPFPEISVKATGGEKSTGLGLAISQRIITAHEGRIWAESESGKGSMFSFALPLRRPQSCNR